MIDRATDDRLFELHAEVCKALANPWRLKLIALLRNGERPLRELVRGMREVLRQRLAATGEIARALSNKPTHRRRRKR